MLSEESASTATSNRRWILDPIDGTFNFVERRPGVGNHVALEVDGEVVLGVITRPVYEQRVLGDARQRRVPHRRHRRRTDNGSPCRRRPISRESAAVHLDAPSDAQLEQWGSGCDGRAAVDARQRPAGDQRGHRRGDRDAAARDWDQRARRHPHHRGRRTVPRPEGGRRLDLGPSRYTNGQIDASLARLPRPADRPPSALRPISAHSGRRRDS